MVLLEPTSFSATRSRTGAVMAERSAISRSRCPRPGATPIITNALKSGWRLATIRLRRPPRENPISAIWSGFMKFNVLTASTAAMTSSIFLLIFGRLRRMGENPTKPASASARQVPFGSPPVISRSPPWLNTTAGKGPFPAGLQTSPESFMGLVR